MSARILPRLSVVPQPVADAVPAWVREIQQAVTDPAELIRLLKLDSTLLDGARQAGQKFPLRVPRGYVARMHPGDANDPLLRQVLPLGEETASVEGFVTDPVGDLASLRGPGILHKYHGRALLMTTGACGIHCRFCFRRHFPYTEQNAAREQWHGALEMLAAAPDIHEVILSGGDPLSLSDRRLAELVEGLDRIPHIQRLRIHTRQPVVLPERVDDNLIDWIGRTRLHTVMVIHANHANELDFTVAHACARLRQAGVSLLNQSVLLRGVNDDAGSLIKLSEGLISVGVLPYYLHLLDRVAGAAHFEVPESEAVALHREISARLPGYLVPRLVREQPGQPGKTPILT